MKTAIKIAFLIGACTGCKVTQPSITADGIADITFSVVHPASSKYAFDSVQSGYIVDEANDSTYHYVYKVRGEEIIGAGTEHLGGPVSEIYTYANDFETFYHASVGGSLSQLSAATVRFEMVEGEGGVHQLYERTSNTLCAFDDAFELEGINTCQPIEVKKLTQAHPANAERIIISISVLKYPLPALECME